MLGSISNRSLLEPRSLADALRMRRDEGPVVPMAGCTDLYVSLNFGTLKETRFLNLWRLDALRAIELRGDVLVRKPRGHDAKRNELATREPFASARSMCHEVSLVSEQ